MLSVYFGHMEGELRVPDVWFDHRFDKSNLRDDFAKRVVKEIDKSDLISEHLVISPVLGDIPTSRLSSGAKALILYYYTDKVVSLISCGKNCMPLLAEIASKKDITVATPNFINFWEFGYKGEVEVLNTGVTVDEPKSLLDEMFKSEGQS